MSKIDKTEYEKRIRIVQEWIIDENPFMDIVTQVTQKWGVGDRQARNYIKTARERWLESDDQNRVEQKRRLKIETLKKLKRSMKDQYKGTPFGIRAILGVEKEISKLENLYHPLKIEATGKDGEPLFPQYDLKNLSDEELDLILKAKKKAKVEG